MNRNNKTPTHIGQRFIKRHELVSCIYEEKLVSIVN